MKLVALDVQTSRAATETPDSVFTNPPSRTFRGEPIQLDMKARFVLEVGEEVRIPNVEYVGPSGMNSWLTRMLADSDSPESPIGSSLESSKQRVVLTVRPALDGAPTLREVVRPGETASTTVACQVITSGGELLWVHVPLEFQVTVIG